MAYSDRTNPAQRMAGIAGTLIVHGAMAVVIVTGLTVAGTIVRDPDAIVSFDIFEPPAPPPPETVPEAGAQAAPPAPIVAPVPPIAIARPSRVETVTKLPPVSDSVVLTVPPPSQRIALPPPALPEIAPPALIEPVRARPASNPSGWVTDRDFRDRWAREGLTGTARFRLEVGADGRVSACTITSSTGHAALDRATCTLIQRRARFEPARNEYGEAVPGSYASTIEWRLP